VPRTVTLAIEDATPRERYPTNVMMTTHPHFVAVRNRTPPRSSRRSAEAYSLVTSLDPRLGAITRYTKFVGAGRVNGGAECVKSGVDGSYGIVG
jgi:hypothetical protein